MEGKFKVILAVLMVQVVGGALYIWSRFAGPLIQAYGFTSNQLLWIYAITIACFSIGLIFSSKLLVKKGPQTTATIGAIIFGSGIILASFANTSLLLGLSYGVLGGLGSGIMYLAPLTTLVRWLPNRRGLANGICVMGFALSTLIFIPIANILLGSNVATSSTMQHTFLTMGIIYLIVALIGARLLVYPPGFKPEVQPETDIDVPLKEVVKTNQFWLIASTILFGCVPGVFLISSASKLGQAMAGLSVAQASLLVIALGIFNAAGRLFAGWLGDKIGTLNAYRIVFVITTISVAMLAYLPVTLVTFLIGFVGIVIGFGATIALAATTTIVLFGPKYFGSNGAYVMLAYGASAILAVLIKMYGHLELTQVFTASFISGVIALISVFMIKPYTKKSLRKTQ